MPFDREQIKVKAADLAAQGVNIGTSSWKCEGWLNQLYTPGRYEYRGKVATKRFERDCLREYSEVFKTVCVDAAYYMFPRREYLHGLVDWRSLPTTYVPTTLSRWAIEGIAHHQSPRFLGVSGRSKSARDGQMKTGHFESGIAQSAATAALMRNEPTQREPVPFPPTPILRR